MSLNKLFTYDFLYKEYCICMKSTVLIANENNCTTTTILKYLKKFRIRTRSKSQAQKNYLNKGGKIPTEGKCRTEEEKTKIKNSLSKYWKNKKEKYNG